MPFWHAIFYHFLASFFVVSELLWKEVSCFMSVCMCVLKPSSLNHDKCLSLPSLFPSFFVSLPHFYRNVVFSEIYLLKILRLHLFYSWGEPLWSYIQNESLLMKHNKNNNDLRLLQGDEKGEKSFGVGRQTNKSYRYHAWLNRLKQLKLFVNRGRGEYGGVTKRERSNKQHCDLCT